VTTEIPDRSPSKVTYSPSPRPSFDVPTLISRAGVTRHIWGDEEAGLVADWIYASTERVHALVFGLAQGQAFRHSREFRTVFGADEVLYVLAGTMILANPESGEVERVERGESIFFRADTWHHAFAHGSEPLRVLELFAPPPAAGASGAYSRTRPFLEASTYLDKSVLGNLPSAEGRARTLHPVTRANVACLLDGDALIGLQASTEHITVGTLSLSPGAASTIHEHGGDEVLYCLAGTLHVRAWFEDQTYVFELERDDAVLLPLGARHEYRNYGADVVEALFGVAPAYLPESRER
jgi:mannose-6-phosphate isomerase-like protein (cupin superfamily)